MTGHPPGNNEGRKVKTMKWFYATTIGTDRYAGKSTFDTREEAVEGAEQFHAKHPEMPVWVVNGDVHGDWIREERLY